MKFDAQNILIIGKVWPEPNSSAAGTRMMQLIHFFLEQNTNVTFASHAKKTEFQEDLEQLNVSCQTIQHNCNSFNDFVEQLNPEIIIFDRFSIEEQFAWRVQEVCPNALRILNTEDLHFVREARHEALKKNTKIDWKTFRSDIQLRELASIYRSDISLMVSDFECDLLTETYNIPKEKVVHLPIHTQKQESILPFAKRKDFLFIGNFWHAPNWDSVRYLKTEIWPKLRKKVPEARMLIYGAYCSEKVYQLENQKERFFVLGRANDVSKITSKAKVSLAPLRFGAGIKGKLLEAMSHGTPSVTTEIGAEGMHGNLDWAGCIENDPNNFVEKASELYLNQNAWEKAQENGFEILQKRFSKQKFEKTLMETLTTIEDLENHRSQSLVGSILLRESFQASRYLSIWIEEKKRNGRGGS